MNIRSVRSRLVAVAGVLATALAAAFAISPASANWQDVEYDHAPVTAMNCSSGTGFDTSAWGRVLSGTLGSIPLDPVLAVRGITASNLAPSTASVASGASPSTALGNDAWSSALDVHALSALAVGAGVTLPLNSGTGIYTQYARATAAGQSTGASGALTSAGGGLVSLDAPTGTPPVIGELSLSTILDAVVAEELGAGLADRLADLGVEIGAVGAKADSDACAAAWSSTADPASFIDRDYLLSSIGLRLKSSILGALTGAVAGSMTSTETTLDALLAPGTSITGAALGTLTSALTPILSINVLGIPLSSGGVSSVKIGVDFDLQPVRDLLSGVLTSGAVRIDLATGTISADLAGANGLVDLNTLAPNSPLLTPTTVTKLVQDVTDAVGGLLSGPVASALSTAVYNARVTVEVVAGLKALGITVIDLAIGLDGTLGAFTGASGYGVVTPAVVATALPNLLSVLDPLGLGLINVNGLLSGVSSSLAGPLVSTFVPALAGAVLNGVLSSAQAAVASSLDQLSTTTLPPLFAEFTPVFTLLQRVLTVTVNAQPDQPGSVGFPDGTVPGRYFVSAVKVGVISPSTADSLLALFFASASVGPNVPR